VVFAPVQPAARSPTRRTHPVARGLAQPVLDPCEIRKRSSSVSFDAVGGMVRLRIWVATLRHSARFASISEADAALRNAAGFFAFAGLWQAAQF